MILQCSEANLRYVSSYFLSVSPAVTWLTVYRRLHTDRSRLDPRQLRNYWRIWGRFFEKVEFLYH